MNATDAGTSTTYTHLQNAMGLGFADALHSALNVMMAEQREFDDLTADIATRYDLPVGELRERIRARAAGAHESCISAAYAVAAEFWQLTPRPEPLTTEQMAELGNKLNQLLRIDADIMAKRRWQPPPSFKRRGSRN